MERRAARKMRKRSINSFLRFGRHQGQKFPRRNMTATHSNQSCSPIPLPIHGGACDILQAVSKSRISYYFSCVKLGTGGRLSTSPMMIPAGVIWTSIAFENRPFSRFTNGSNRCCSVSPMRCNGVRTLACSGLPLVLAQDVRMMQERIRIPRRDWRVSLHQLPPAS